MRSGKQEISHHPTERCFPFSSDVEGIVFNKHRWLQTDGRSAQVQRRHTIGKSCGSGHCSRGNMLQLNFYPQDRPFEETLHHLNELPYQTVGVLSEGSSSISTQHKFSVNIWQMQCLLSIRRKVRKINCKKKILSKIKSRQNFRKKGNIRTKDHLVPTKNNVQKISLKDI